MPHKKSKANKTAKKSMLAQRQKSMRTQLRSTNKVNSPNIAKLNIIKEDESVRDFARKKALNRPGLPGGASRSYKKGGQLSQYE